MRRKLTSALAIGVLAAMSCAGVALATPPSGVTNPAWSPVIGQFPGGFNAEAEADSETATGDWEMSMSAEGATDVHILENIIAPGGSFGWHSHPGPSLVIVKSGTLSVYRGGPNCKRRDFGPGSPLGSTFVDQGNDRHLVRNNTTVVDDVYVVSFVPAGAARRIDRPNPNPSVCPN